MKKFSWRIFIFTLTFWIGISIVVFWYLLPALQSSGAQSIPRGSAAWQKLLTFENKDLSKLNTEVKALYELNEASEEVIGKQRGRPRLICKALNSDGEIRYLYIWVRPPAINPGETILQIFVFNEEGNLQFSTGFIIGYRMVLGDIKVVHKAEIDRDVIEIEYMIGRSTYGKQYYTLVGETPLLIRLEDENGNLTPNDYSVPHHGVGLTITGRSTQDWEKALASNDTAELLATLTWINGEHLKPDESSDEWKESADEARIANALQSSETVKSRLDELSKSDNKWIREAAANEIPSERK